VFRPFKGEIVEAVLTDSDATGIRLRLNFFADIWVPAPNSLFSGSRYDPTEGVWIWRTDDGHEFYFDRGEHVLFRVEAEEWGEIPSSASTAVLPSAAPLRAPYRVIGSMMQSGLGPNVWWEEGEED